MKLKPIKPLDAKTAKSMVTTELKKKVLDYFVVEQNELPFETIIAIKDKPCEERWTPKSVNDLGKRIYISCDNTLNKKIKENVIYNLQYLEYLQKQLSELNLRDPIRRMINKNYILTAVSIIEGLFTYYLKKTGNYSYSEWKIFKTENMENAKLENLDGKLVKKQVEYYEKVDKYEVSMNLDAMIQKICDNNYIEFDETDIFAKLNKNRKLRNEIHIQSESIFKSDYKTFDDNTQITIKNLLYKILTCKEFFFGDDREKYIIYDFLI